MPSPRAYSNRWRRRRWRPHASGSPIPSHEIIAWDDPDYPRALLDLGHAPPALFFVGRRELLNRPALAIVGSRNATAQGTENARAFAQALSQAGLDHRVRPRGRHRRRRASRARWRARARRWPSSAPASIACTRRAIATSRTGSPRTAACISEFPAGHAPQGVELSAPQPADQRTRARRAGGGGGAVVGIADHRALRRRTGTRGVRHSGVDSLAVVQGLPQADSRGRQARRNGAGHPRGIRHGLASPRAWRRARQAR